MGECSCCIIVKNKFSFYKFYFFLPQDTYLEFFYLCLFCDCFTNFFLRMYVHKKRFKGNASNGIFLWEMRLWLIFIFFLNVCVTCKFSTVNIVFTFLTRLRKQCSLLKINSTNITDTYKVKMRFPFLPEESRGPSGRGQTYLFTECLLVLF